MHARFSSSLLAISTVAVVFLATAVSPSPASPALIRRDNAYSPHALPHHDDGEYDDEDGRLPIHHDQPSYGGGHLPVHHDRSSYGDGHLPDHHDRPAYTGDVLGAHQDNMLNHAPAAHMGPNMGNMVGGTTFVPNGGQRFVDTVVVHDHRDGTVLETTSQRDTVSPVGSVGAIHAGQPGPMFGAPGPAFGAPGPAFGAPRPAFGAPGPAFGAPGPAFGAPRPAFGAPGNPAPFNPQLAGRPLVNPSLAGPAPVNMIPAGPALLSRQSFNVPELFALYSRSQHKCVALKEGKRRLVMEHCSPEQHFDLHSHMAFHWVPVNNNLAHLAIFHAGARLCATAHKIGTYMEPCGPNSIKYSISDSHKTHGDGDEISIRDGGRTSQCMSAELHLHMKTCGHFRKQRWTKIHIAFMNQLANPLAG